MGQIHLVDGDEVAIHFGKQWIPSPHPLDFTYRTLRRLLFLKDLFIIF
jgi:hypothetical protein